MAKRTREAGTAKGGDFNSSFNAHYWSPEKETAEREWAARRCPGSDTCLIQIQVSNAFIERLRSASIGFSGLEGVRLDLQAGAGSASKCDMQPFGKTLEDIAMKEARVYDFHAPLHRGAGDAWLGAMQYSIAQQALVIESGRRVRAVLSCIVIGTCGFVVAKDLSKSPACSNGRKDSFPEVAEVVYKYISQVDVAKASGIISMVGPKEVDELRAETYIGSPWSERFRDLRDTLPTIMKEFRIGANCRTDGYDLPDLEDLSQHRITTDAVAERFSCTGMNRTIPPADVQTCITRPTDALPSHPVDALEA
ncbi:hypothetical protein CNMCM5793_008877 [Aspergillus hiratsukae]|uniref:Uncharacterized protein n=1 Tax=Aspergillus hiratsukae TaxID=1194566 RepID=A0A8H6P894_9EURO|nr:hypothetical protein CNMCM5793_008877 [Aspergillus hiratsukae]KAF7160762.1 hypothetical protein CNMCM6106_008168 [Aspergillus hiratsukae]